MYQELTMEETVILETAPAKKCVKGMQSLLTLNRFGIRPINIWRALGREHIHVGFFFCQIPVSKEMRWGRVI